MRDIEPTEEQKDIAALWVAKRTAGPLTSADAAALEAWLAADRRHRLAYDDLRVLYLQLEEPARRAAEVNPLGRQLARRLRPRWSWLIAPLVPAAALLIMWIVNPAILQDWQADIVTGRDAYVSTISLPDGSLARLGADTALALNFNGNARHIKLIRGEAYFEVEHGPAGSFTVTANGDTIRDIGTKFNVDVLNHKTTVAVTEGMVEVSGSALPDAVRIGQGHLIVVSAGRPGPLQTAEAELALAWMSGRLVVQGARVSDVAAALQRHHMGRIVVRGALADQDVSGTFPLTDIEGSVQTLAAAINANVLHATPLLTVLY